MPTKDITLPELVERFGSEDACHDALEELRWPDGVACPRCGSTAISRIKKRRQFDCDGCRYQFSVRVGTIFHDSKLPLWKWFLAVYMMVQSKKGVSANQLKRMLGVSYKTAWFLCHRIRAAMGATDEAKLSGVIEIDETFVGGEPRYKTDKRTAARKRLDNKAVVLAAVQRDGEIRMNVVPTRHKPHIRAFVEKTVGPDAEAVYTDEFRGYHGTTGDVPHESIRHTARGKEPSEWVRGKVHTNTVEGVFSLLKRSIVGSYHMVSVKHLPAYIDEMEWRYNNRDNPYLFRDTLLELIDAKQLQYGELIASSSAGLR